MDWGRRKQEKGLTLFSELTSVCLVHPFAIGRHEQKCGMCGSVGWLIGNVT